MIRKWSLAKDMFSNKFSLAKRVSDRKPQPHTRQNFFSSTPNLIQIYSYLLFMGFTDVIKNNYMVG